MDIEQLFEVDNISFKIYAQLKDTTEYDYILKYSRLFNVPVDRFNVGELTEKPFGLVKDLQYDLNNGVTWMQLLEYFEKLTDKPVTELSNYGLLELNQFKQFIFEEVAKINEIEKVGLASTIEQDEERAGIDRFSVYGNYIQFVDLANDDILKIEEVKKLKYIDCFMLLKLRHDRNEYQKELFRIKTAPKNDL